MSEDKGAGGKKTRGREGSDWVWSRDTSGAQKQVQALLVYCGLVAQEVQILFVHMKG